MGEARLVGLFAVAWLAAMVGRWLDPSAFTERPWLLIGVGGVGFVVAVARGRQDLLVAAVALVSLGRSLHVEQHHVEVVPRVYAGWVRLVTDPEPGRFGANAEVSLDDGRRVQASVGWDQPHFESLVAGEAVFVEGHLRSIDPTDWARSRHLTGRMRVSELGARASMPWWGRPSHALRSAVQAGADRLPPEFQALYTGLVIGDDRYQSKGQQARFRLAGLSHLLAVSGQNVAFVLAVAEPLIGRLRWWPRWSATVALLLVFAVATRLEPSVLRATGTALVSVWALSTGARASGVRALMIAGTALVIVDPFLVWSVGFRLSLAASMGILVVGPVIGERLPGAGGPTGSWWRSPLTVTLGAQAGVTPLLVGVFGPVALVSVPANLLAGWAAGFVMTWGLTGGLLAGLLGAEFVQWPVVVAMWWIDTVATVSLRLPSPVIGGGASVLALLSFLGGWFVGATTRVGRWICWIAAGLLLALTVPQAPDQPTDLVGGGRYWPSASEGDSVSVLVVSASADDRLIESVVERRVRVVDVVVLETGGRTMSMLATELGGVVDAGVVLAPPQHRVVGGRRLLAPVELEVGGSSLTVGPVDDDRLGVTSRSSP